MEFEKLQHIIAGVLSLDPEDITREMTFVEDLGADSLDVFQIVMGIEDAFDVILEEDVVNQIKTVGDVLVLVNPAREE